MVRSPRSTITLVPMRSMAVFIQRSIRGKFAERDMVKET